MSRFTLRSLYFRNLINPCLPAPALFGAFLLTSGAVSHAQQPGLTLDPNGAIVLISRNGHHTVLAGQGHCNEILGTPDNRLLACAVSRGVDDQGFRPSLQIEIYYEDGSKLVLEPGGPIRDWHFWNDHQQIAVSSNAGDGQVSHALYNSQSGNLIESQAEPADPAHLPQWARSQTQVDDESVPTDTASQEMRNKWMDKTLRQIETIQPGMHRRDLATLFRPDGGINPIGNQERYVLKECTMIKIDVSFKAPDETSPVQHKNPDDVIESVSKPYLQYPTMD